MKGIVLRELIEMVEQDLGLEIVREGRGKHFGPQVVDAILDARLAPSRASDLRICELLLLYHVGRVITQVCY